MKRWYVVFHTKTKLFKTDENDINSRRLTFHARLKISFSLLENCFSAFILFISACI